MKQEKRNNNRLIALIATVGSHLLLLLVLLFSYLHYKWPPDDMPLPKDSEILFGGEYVMYGDMNLSKSNDIAASNNDAAVVGDDATDAGEAGDNANLVTTDNPSSMTVKKNETPEKRGPTKEELAEQERIKRQQEVLDIGYEDYIYSGCVCFMEWPELIEDLLPADAVRVTITQQEDGTRVIEM